MFHEKRGPRVEEEAAVLAVAQHPGVVELVDVTEGVLRTRRVEGCPLSDMGPLEAEEIAGLAAAVAATLADLHDLGVVHGGLDASHVIVSDDGQPVLCSLGRGGRPADDVAALGRLVSHLAGEKPADPLRARLHLRHPLRPKRRRRLGPMLTTQPAPALAALAAEAAAANPDRRPTARALATALRDRLPGARLPQPKYQAVADPEHGPHADRPDHDQPARAFPRLWLRAGAGLGAAAVLLVLGAWVLMARAGEERPVPDGAAQEGIPHEASAAAQPATGPVRVWPVEPVHYEHGVLTYRGARYQVGQPGDVVATGDWGCNGRSNLALLRPSTGQLFAFDQWADETGEVTARPVGQVSGAKNLRAVDADGDGCPELEVTRPDGPPAVLDLDS